MTHIILMILLILFISTGAGLLIDRRFHFTLGHYHAPLGFAVYLAALQMTYYPLQLLALSSNWLMAVSSIVTGLFLLYSLIHIKEVLKEYWNIKTLWIISSFAMFFFVLYQCSVVLDSSDSSQYLNLICQNINIEHLGRFSFNNGELGATPDTFYLFQGYYYFGSFLCWLINVPNTIFHISGFTENIATCVWVLGSLYSLISTMFILNLNESFRSKLGRLLPWLLLFLLFYYNFYYWRVAYAFYGNTWRTLLVGMLLWMLYRRYQQNEEVPYIAFFAVIAAGLASSSSYMFISVDILYLLMAWLFVKKEKKAFGTVFQLALPVVFYVFAFACQYGALITAAYTVLILIIYASILFTKDPFQDKADIWMNKYGKILLMIVIPCFFVAFSIYTWITNPYYEINIANYFDNYANYDMILDPFGMYSNPLERILIILKWFGYFLVVKQGWKQRSWLSFTMLFAMVIFLNPITITGISRTYTYNVYYRAFDIILNPFMIVIYALVIQDFIGTRKWLPWISGTLAITSVCLMHLNLFTSIETFTSYNYQLKDGINKDPILKISDEDYSVFMYIRDAELVPSDHQITVISHADGFKTFFPTVYQLYTKNQVYYTDGRLDEDFYQMAKRHFGWEEKETKDYSQACSYMKKYKVDLAVINVFESQEFDESIDPCMTTILRTKNYTVKTLNP